MAPAHKKQLLFSEKDAREIALEEFGLTAKAQRLPGYVDINFHLKGDCDEEHVLKISDISENEAGLGFQNIAMEMIAKECGELFCPVPCKSLSGKTIVKIMSPGRGGSMRLARLLTFVPGQLMCDAAPHTEGFLESVGSLLGRVDRALEHLTHPAMYRDTVWDLKSASGSREYLGDVASRSSRTLAEHFLDMFESLALPVLTCLRSSVIHNDGNDYNVLVKKSPGKGLEATGIIDFSDLLRTQVVCEPAITAAYAALGKEEPFAAAVAVVKGYHSVFPLTEEELSILFPLVCARLCTSVCLSAHMHSIDPENEYILASEKRAWAVLHRFAGIDPGKAETAFFDACGLKCPPATGACTGGGTHPEKMSKDEILRLRTVHIGSSLSVSYIKPIEMVRGFMQYLYDENGRAYLDAVNNVPHVGHCHPKVLGAAKKQMAALNTNTRYLHDNLVVYAKQLCSTMPDRLEVCFFVNSGSEANDLALRLARAYTGRRDMAVVDGAYHGNLAALIDISPYKFNGPGGKGAPPHVHMTTVPDGYRGLYKGTGREAGEMYAACVRETMKRAADEGAGTAAFICESFMGCAGQIIPPENYLKTAGRHAREAGAVFIADEVQVGFGRAGTHFWAFDAQGGEPDIVTLGKPMGNGHPLAAVVTTKEIADAFDTGMEYFNTFGGNPVSCAVGMAVLDVIAEDGLQKNALETGARMKSGLEALMERHAIIGHVRGAGLFIGVELVSDKKSLEPAASEAAFVVERMKEEGVLISTDGPLKNVLKIKPPLVFTKANADFLVDTLDKVLADADKTGKHQDRHV